MCFQFIRCTLNVWRNYVQRRRHRKIESYWCVVGQCRYDIICCSEKKEKVISVAAIRHLIVSMYFIKRQLNQIASQEHHRTWARPISFVTEFFTTEIWHVHIDSQNEIVITFCQVTWYSASDEEKRKMKKECATNSKKGDAEFILLKILAALVRFAKALWTWHWSANDWLKWKYNIFDFFQSGIFLFSNLIRYPLQFDAQENVKIRENECRKSTKTLLIFSIPTESVFIHHLHRRTLQLNCDFLYFLRGLNNRLEKKKTTNNSRATK